MRKLWSPLFIGVLLMNLLAGNAAAQTEFTTLQPDAADAGYTILLRSRSFTPEDGQAAAGLEAVRQQALDLQARQPQAAAPVAAADGRIHALVQLYAIPDAAEIERLADLGILLLDYIPEHAWLAAIESSRLQELAGRLSDLPDAPLRWVGALETADKVSPELFQAQAAQSNGGDAGGASGGSEAAKTAAGESWLTVHFFRDQTPDREQALLAQYGARLGEALPEMHRYDIYLPVGQALALAGEDAVRWLDFGPTAKRTFNNDVRARTGVSAVQAAPYNLTGAGVQLGIWDGGTVDSHLDFSGRLTVVDSGTMAQDHATHVAGTMAGSGANGASYSAGSGFWRGMAPGAGIYSFDWNYSITEHSLAINTHGVDLSQNSWGYVVNNNNCSDYGDYEGDAPAYDAVVTGMYGRKIPVVFAAGNDRDALQCGLSTAPPYINYSTILAPGTAKNVLTVGATYADDDTMTNFSSWGPTDDGRLKPEIVAPGCKKVTYQDVSGIISTYPGNKYGGMCGTSMAAPAISGITALLIQQYRLSYGGADPLPATLKAALIQTAQDLNDGTSYYNYGPDYASGYGRVDAKAAADLIIARKLLQDSVGSGASDTFFIDVPSGTGELKISLAWDDRYAVENASKTLVNNLNLSLKSPSGTTVLPLVLNPAIPSQAAANGVDAINNIEQVRVTSPAAGKWTVTVSGASVPYGPQAYTLAGANLSNNSAPNTPSAPLPANTAAGQAPGLTLGWTGGDPDKDNTTYDVYLGTANPPAALKCSDSVSLACKTGALLNNTTYYWKVVATDAKGASTSGPVWRFTTTPSGVPAAYSKGAPGSEAVGAMVSPTLRWDGSSGAGSYQYCYATSTAGCTNWTSTSQTSATLAGLANNTRYYWQVRASGPSGTTYANGSSSAYWSFTTLAAIPGGVLGKSSPGNGAALVQISTTVSWDPVAGATSYQFCYDTSNDDSCSTWTSASTATSVKLYDLQPFTTYYWQARALTPSGTVYANSGAWWNFYTGLGQFKLFLPFGKK